MRRTLCRMILGAAALVSASPQTTHAGTPPPFEWKDGDRVVLVGDTLIERDQKYGYIETLVTTRNPAKSIVFRNLGWSGDTVLGLSRAGFGKPPEGFRRLTEHVLALKPTVLVVGYGMAASFDGEAGLPAFVSGLNTLLDALKPANARLVLLSPIAHEDLGRPLPDPSSHNRDLARYRDAVREVARERDARFVDLIGLRVGQGTAAKLPHPHTDNGIHLNAFGSWFLASAVLSGLDQSPARWEVVLEPETERPGTGAEVRTLSARSSKGTTLSGVRLNASGLRFEARDHVLPDAPPPPGTPGSLVPVDRRLTVGGLAPGTYVLKVDGQRLARASDSAWGRGVRIDACPEREQVEALRKVINRKNELYFYRWRPQNETYLFGFRKYEQGNNAREIPLFDPLVEAEEKAIAKQRMPVPHVYELTVESEVTK